LTTSRLSELDARVWLTATWAAPFVVQIVVGIAIAFTWLAGRYVPNVHGFAQYLSGAAATLVLVGAVGGSLFVSTSLRARGIAISIFGSLAVTLVGGLLYGFWVIGW
jgi:hypothetical protein